MYVCVAMLLICILLIELIKCIQQEVSFTLNLNEVCHKKPILANIYDGGGGYVAESCKVCGLNMRLVKLVQVS